MDPRKERLMRVTVFSAGLLFLVIAIPAGAQGWGECAGISGNLVGALNCDFTDGVNHWTFSSVMGTWTSDASKGYPSPPSGTAEAVDPSSYAFTITSDCIAVSAGTDHTLGVYSNTPGGATIGCAGRIEEFTTADCSGSSTVTPDVPFTPVPNEWTPFSTTWTTGATTQSAYGWIDCSADASFTVLFDNIVLVEGDLPVELQAFTVE